MAFKGDSSTVFDIPSSCLPGLLLDLKSCMLKSLKTIETVSESCDSSSETLNKVQSPSIGTREEVRDGRMQRRTVPSAQLNAKVLFQSLNETL
jgi:hypothetical protein